MSHSGEGVRRGSKMWLFYFSNSGCRGREKIIEETDRNIMESEKWEGRREWWRLDFDPR